MRDRPVDAHTRGSIYTSLRQNTYKSRSGKDNRIFGYDSEDGKLVPNEYADAVRTIYKLFLDGKTFTEIADAMRESDIIFEKEESNEQ